MTHTQLVREVRRCLDVVPGLQWTAQIDDTPLIVTFVTPASHTGPAHRGVTITSSS